MATLPTNDSSPNPQSTLKKEHKTSEEYRLHLQIRRLETGEFLATSDDFPGLVAQGRTVAETIEICRDVARKLIESHREHGDPLPKTLRSMITKVFEFDVPVGV